MIHLISGKDGNGKGLFAIQHIQKKAAAENRAVFYHGIPNLKLDWHLMDSAADWQKCPDGAIIVIDEAQYTYKTLPTGSPLPPHIENLNVNRKGGFDIFFVTQDPMQLHTRVRSLVQSHYHLVRVFGKEESKLHHWNTCKEDAIKSRKDSIVTDFKFPKELYGVYESAQLHTVKANVPFRYYLKYIIPVIVIALVALAAYALMSAKHKSEKGFLGENAKSDVDSAPRSEKSRDLPWPVQQIPRIPELPYSAPKYDEVTRAQYAPIPAACIASKTRCKCWSQQGTALDVGDSVCRQVVANGFFVDFQDKWASNSMPQPAQRRNDGLGMGGQSPAHDDASSRAPVPIFAPANMPHLTQR